MSRPIKANEIGVFQNPSAPTEQKAKTPMRGATSPFRAARQSVVQPAAFKPIMVKTKVKPNLGQEVPVVDLQSVSSIINVQKSVQQSQMQEMDKQEQMTSEVLHFMSDPQILVSYVTAPGELPRSIALERKRRQIAQQDFVKMFSAFIDSIKGNESKLALELFDDETYETKPLDGWFACAKKVEVFDQQKNTMRTVKGVYGHCYLDNQWQKCIVIGRKQNT